MKSNIIILLLFFLFSCTLKNKKSESSVTSSSIDKAIIIPELDKLSYLALSDTFDIQQYYIDFLKSNTKIVVYADSLSCVECDMRFEEWKLKIRELRLRDINAKILFLLNFDYYQTVKYLIERDMFGVPIFFESDKSFLKSNNLPENLKRRTFILNGDNNVVLVGDPISNESMWEQYKQVFLKN